MNLAISILEIAVIILLPLIIILNRTGIGVVKRVCLLSALYVVWYLTYSAFHEACHFVAAKAMSLEVVGFRFIPEFWKGDFAGGFVRTEYENSLQEFIVVIIPYLRDVALVAVGYVLFRRKILRGVIPVSLALMILVLSSVYDLLDNYFAYCRGNWNDFWAMGHLLPVVLVHSIGVTFLVLAFLGGGACMKMTFKQVAGDEGDC